MYHPNAMLQIAHTREAELVREAQRFGLPQAEGTGPNLPKRMLAIGAWLAVFATVLALFVAQSPLAPARRGGGPRQ